MTHHCWQWKLPRGHGNGAHTCSGPGDDVQPDLCQLLASHGEAAPQLWSYRCFPGLMRLNKRKLRCLLLQALR